MTTGIIPNRRESGLRRIWLLTSVFCLLILQGCSYTTKNALPPHIKTVAVPMFVNKTYVTDYTRKIEVEVTQAVRNAFMQTGELKLAQREDADIILEGTIANINRDVVRVNRFSDPAEVQYEIRARISVYDLKEAKYLLKDHLVTNSTHKPFSGNYNLQRGEYESAGRNSAVADIGRAIARQITEAWPARKERRDD